MNLTNRQREIYEFLKSYLVQHGLAPTVDEIRDHFNLNSLATVHKHLKALEKRRKIFRSKNHARAIELIEESTRGMADIPLLGLISAGQPIEALENPDILAIPDDMLGRSDTFALQVNGDSMIEDGIHHGDYIVVESRDKASNGEIVVAMVGGDEATVKRFYREGAVVRLQPSNQYMDPIFVAAEKVQIRGVVIGLIRKYRRM